MSMATATPSLDLLERALDQTGSVISRVRADQAGLPTPCTEFDVRALLNHIVFDLQTFTAGLNGGERGSPDADLIGADWTAAYDAARASLLDAWHQRGIDTPLKTRIGEFPATWGIGQHLADMAVHAWDVAIATRQSTKLDPEVARVALDWARANLKPEYRGQAFGPEVEVPENAPIYERLVGWFGRNPY
jgi:uncharacterized protein (TIGR03086 family)